MTDKLFPLELTKPTDELKRKEAEGGGEDG